MGPRHLSRGILQETKHESELDAMASMGPRHLSRGISASCAGADREGPASMGPRHLSRGIGYLKIVFDCMAQLQWGHGI